MAHPDPPTKEPAVSGWLGKASVVVAAIASVAAIVLGVRDLFDLRGPGWAKVLAWFAVGLTVTAVVALYAEQFRHRREVTRLYKRHFDEVAKLNRSHQQDLDAYRRRARVGVALPALHDAFHFLRDAAVLVGAGETEAADRDLRLSLEHMTSVFDSVTGAPCRMCVKELTADPNTPDHVDAERDLRFFHVVTLYRHDGSRDLKNDDPTPLHANSDFLQVWDKEQSLRCFFSNDLDDCPGYTNPHRRGDPRDFEYNAAIVWPIQKKRDDGVVRLVGFLCVDSKEKHIFEYANDFDLGAAYADSLFTVLSMRKPRGAKPIGGSRTRFEETRDREHTHDAL